MLRKNRSIFDYHSDIIICSSTTCLLCQTYAFPILTEPSLDLNASVLSAIIYSSIANKEITAELIPQCKLLSYSNCDAIQNQIIELISKTTISNPILLITLAISLYKKCTNKYNFINKLVSYLQIAISTPSNYAFFSLLSILQCEMSN